MTNIDLVGTPFSSNKPYLFRAIHEWILDNEGTPYLLVDATQPSVKVPQEHVKDGQIILNVSPNAIQSWFADNEAISFNARFSGKAQQIYIPMNALLAVYAQENSLGMAFPEAVDQPDTENATVSEDSKPSETEEQSTSESNPSNGKKADKPSHLKVIK